MWQVCDESLRGHALLPQQPDGAGVASAMNELVLLLLGFFFFF